MADQLVIVGAGGFGREVLDVVDALNAEADEPIWEVSGVVDDAPSEANLERLRRRGVAHLGPTDSLLKLESSTAFSVGIGTPIVRKELAERFERAGMRPATLIHPTATQGYDVQIGAGSIICAGVRITTNVILGRHVHLNLNATVGHDSSVGDFVSVNPLASISGDCVIEDEVLIGVAGVVLNGLTVSRGAVVGGCACVVKDVPAQSTVKGVPAK